MEGLIEAFTGSPDPEAARRIRQARRLAGAYLREDLTRMNDEQAQALKRQAFAKAGMKVKPSTNLEDYRSQASLQPEMASMALNGYVPGTRFGEEMSLLDDDAASKVADAIEKQYGTLEQKVSWRNGSDYTKAGAEYANNQAWRHGGDVEEAYLASSNLLSPERLDYMQKVGRTVDLLRGLKDSPVRSADFYSGSAKEPLARNAANFANYQRFEGLGPTEFMEDPSNPVSWYLRTSNIVPVMIRSTADGAGTAAANTLGYTNFNQRFRRGPVEVLDVPSDATPEEYFKRQAEVQQLANDLAPPSWQHTVGKVPRVVGDTLGFFGEMLDPSAGAALATGGAGMLAGLATKKAATTAPSLAARAMSGAGVFGRGIMQEVKPEVMFGAPFWGMQAVSDAPDKTMAQEWGEYFFSPASPEARNPEATTRAANVLDSLKRSNPQDIWEQRQANMPKKVADRYSTWADFQPMY